LWSEGFYLECISLLMLLKKNKNARASSCTPRDSKKRRGIPVHLRNGDDEREADCGVELLVEQASDLFPLVRQKCPTYRDKEPHPFPLLSCGSV
jgi:hypothetical protein